MAVYKVNANGKAPKGLNVDDEVVTNGGVYKILEVHPDGSYSSEKVSEITSYAEYVTGVKQSDFPDTVEGQKAYVNAIAKAAGNPYRNEEGKLIMPWEEAKDDK